MEITLLLTGTSTAAKTFCSQYSLCAKACPLAFTLSASWKDAALLEGRLGYIETSRLAFFLFRAAAAVCQPLTCVLVNCRNFTLFTSRTMIIFKDLLTGDEMFTDSSKYKLIDGCIYEVECRHISRTLGDIQLEGANPSQEEADEGTDSSVETGLDLVLNQRLVETGFSKNDYKVYLKGYTKALQDKWKEMGKSDSEINEAKAKFTEAVKKILPKIGDLQFFMGESSNPDGLIALLEYRPLDNGEEKPVMMFFKHGLEEEKV